jgi:glycosyltransferase involved in cell wall biosynthesis
MDSTDSIGVANRESGLRMWQGSTLAVVLPAYNEVDSIEACIRGFESLDVVDEVLVVNNNAPPEVAENVSKTDSRQVLESRQGYGAAIRRGLAETKGFDLVAICEPDGTFEPEDLFKLLPFLSDADLVLGSRTVSTFIYTGANMGLFLRWGNWAVAKGVELLFNTVSLSDVGCTFRVMKRSAIDAITPEFDRYDSAFGLEIMLHVISARIPLVQVPVRYKARVGDSTITGDFGKAFRLGMTMIGMSILHRLRTWPFTSRLIGPPPSSARRRA